MKHVLQVMSPPLVHIKSSVAAWRVHEDLQLPFAGHGEHAYFYVEKQNLNTLDVARALAQACRVGLAQIGYAGLKDKQAVTRQWFSVPYPQDRWPLQQSCFAADTTVRCLEFQRHTHKLRHGAHRANLFSLLLRGAPDPGADVWSRLDDWFPNYFGPQRVSPQNCTAARRWLTDHAAQRQAGQRRGKPRRAGRRGWHLSVLRSELFNAVLQRRVALGNFSHAIAGDVEQDGIPTGPLWGRGRSPATAQAAEIERCALQPYQEVCGALEFTGAQQGRRPLTQKPGRLQHCAHADGVELRFELPPGAYATTLLAHHFTVCDDSKPT